MALIKCPECGKEVSNQAKKCPNCGYKVKRRNKKKIIIAASILIVLIVIAGIGITTYQSTQNSFEPLAEVPLGTTKGDLIQQLGIPDDEDDFDCNYVTYEQVEKYGGIGTLEYNFDYFNNRFIDCSYKINPIYEEESELPKRNEELKKSIIRRLDHTYGKCQKTTEESTYNNVDSVTVYKWKNIPDNGFYGIYTLRVYDEGNSIFPMILRYSADDASIKSISYMD